MSQDLIAAKRRRPFRRYGRADVIHDATSLLMERFDLDAAQAVAQLVKVSKRQNDSIEAAARMCVAAGSSGDRYPRPLEPIGDQPHHRRVHAERIGDQVRAAVA
jgi:hypothetical protein